MEPKSITVMKYLGIDGEYHFVIVDDIKFPDLEARLEYLSKIEYDLWVNGEMAKHLWTRTSDKSLWHEQSRVSRYFTWL